MSKTNNVHLQVVSAHVNSRVLILIFKHHIKTNLLDKIT